MMMKEQEAIKLLNRTFNQDFKISDYSIFIKELFNEIGINVEDKTQYIAGQYREHISELRKIGEYKDQDRKKIEILAVKLKRTQSRDRARTMQRNFIANWLNKIDAESALVAFYDESEDWRFSFVKMEYNLVRDEEGKVKIAKELTPAKRYSYLVGIHEPNHTCRSRFLDLVVNEESNPSMLDIEDAFSIDNVTKEFFERYKELVFDLKDSLNQVLSKDQKIIDEFKDKGIETIDFAKKLLGQIVFLYFLQKKRWLGVEKDKEWGSGPKDFLRKLFGDEKKGIKPLIQYNNFFNEILKPLFYDALSNPRPGDDGYYFHFNCKIPFLNGGLFEPINDYDWKGTDIAIDNSIFGKIFEIFDRFNFTVKEDEPLEKEVAVDPEMLGKVFENLLDVKERKDKGAFYTPREIVHYMCQQSLINYLETNTDINREDIRTFIQYGDLALEHVIKDLEQQKTYNGKSFVDEQYLIPKSISNNFKKIDVLLKEIKIVDPAVGSGAFPMGMMNEIVKARSLLSIYFSEDEQKKRTHYDFKRETIENSLYGVDIDQSAVEIAKLRFWLSLIVDETEMAKIKPLPNLDHKIMCGNSLLEEFEGIKLFDEKLLGSFKKDKQFEIKKINNQIIELKDRLKYAKSIIEREKNDFAIKKLKKKINKMAKKSATEQISFVETESEKKIKQLKSFQKKYFNEQNGNIKRDLREKIYKIEWELIEATLKEQDNEDALEKLEQYKKAKVRPFFLWKLYFAEVFQRENPGFDVVIANPPYVKEYVNRTAFNGLRNSPYYKGKMDIWYFFACKSIDLLRADGVLTYIAQNNWGTSYGASIMKNKVINEAQILNLIDFGDYKIFTAGIQTMVMIFKNSNEIDNYTTDVRKLYYDNKVTFQDVLDMLSKRENKYIDYLTPIITRKKYINTEITFSKKNVQIILDKMVNKSNFKIAEREATNGIHHHHDIVNRKRQEILGDDFKIGQGIFLLTEKEKNGIPFTKKELEIIKPEYTTKELNKYYTNKRNKHWVIYTESCFKDTEKIKEYSNIKNHLDKFSAVITSDNKPYGLHRARDEKFFLGEKIISVRKCSEPTFTYTDFDCYVSATFYIIKTDRLDMKYLTTLLNSSLIAFWLRHKGKMQGNNYQIDKEPILKIPFINPPNEKKNALIDQMNQIIHIINTEEISDYDKQSSIKRLEDNIDQLVYKLYELTPEEIKIVEEFCKGR